MGRFFNTTGPGNPQDHYMLPTGERLAGASLDRYIKNQLYWGLHTPRQTGKTTFLQSWIREINAGGEGVACYVSVERCQGISEAEIAIPAVCRAIVEFAKKELPAEQVPEYKTYAATSQLGAMLTGWASPGWLMPWAKNVPGSLPPKKRTRQLLSTTSGRPKNC